MKGKGNDYINFNFSVHHWSFGLYEFCSIVPKHKIVVASCSNNY